MRINQQTRARVAAAVLAAVVFVSGPTVTAAEICHEDAACWDGRTMGNQITGELDAWGRTGGPNLAGVDTGYVLVRWVVDAHGQVIGRTE